MVENVAASHALLANYPSAHFTWALPEANPAALPVALRELLRQEASAARTGSGAGASAGGGAAAATAEVPSRKAVEEADRIALQSCVNYVTPSPHLSPACFFLNVSFLWNKNHPNYYQPLRAFFCRAAIICCCLASWKA